MKLLRKTILTTIIILFVVLSFASIKNYVYAHNADLDVEYDICDLDEGNLWYYISSQKYVSYPHGERVYYKDLTHLSQEVTTISYYINNNSKDNVNYTWTTNLTEEEALNVKQTFVNSMLKWNDIYYYSYDQQGNRVTNKVINIVETLEKNNAEIVIYPKYEVKNDDGLYYACTSQESEPNTIEEDIKEEGSENYSHSHVLKWDIEVNLYMYNPREEEFSHVSKVTGEHEIGHVLGLRDVDTICDHYLPQHSELLMGYGGTSNSHVTYATYKDIAGVSITRGFHDVDDHIWMKRINDDGSIDLICALCNGIMKNITLDSNGLTYNGKMINKYKDCIHYGKYNSNMLLVATDGIRNFFKCLNCRHIDTIEINNEYNLLNELTMINDSYNINAGKKNVFKLNIDRTNLYEILLNSTSPSEIRLYDENFNKITTFSSVDNTTLITNKILNAGTYYIEIENKGTNSANYTMKIIFDNSVDLREERNNILLNINRGIGNYRYYNTNGAGFYKFSLYGTKTDNSLITYPSGSLKIYDNALKNVLMNKYKLDVISNYAQSKYNENSIIVYLSRNDYFFLNIDIPANDLSSLYLDITQLENQEINLFNYSETSDQTQNILNINSKGDYFKKILIKQTGKFVIYTNFEVQGNNNIIFVLLKLDYDISTNTSTTTTVIEKELTNEYDSYQTTVSLTDGTYYIGYFDKYDLSNFRVSFKRLISLSGGDALVTDPDSGTLCGSQINIIEMNKSSKSYRETYITRYFTRVIYPDSNLGISNSRLDYNWYSSDETIATVSSYGTVFGKNFGTVKIMAVLKNDPSKTFVKEFSVIDDIGANPLTIINTYTVKFTDRRNFKINFEKINCPYPWIQYYNWSLDTKCHNSKITVSMDKWGTIKADDRGCFTLTGSYTLNTRITIKIHVIIS